MSCEEPKGCMGGSSKASMPAIKTGEVIVNHFMTKAMFMQEGAEVTVPVMITNANPDDLIIEHTTATLPVVQDQ